MPRPLRNCDFMRKVQGVTLPRIILMGPDLITQKRAMIKELNGSYSVFFRNDSKSYSMFSFLFSFSVLLEIVSFEFAWFQAGFWPWKNYAYISLLWVLRGIWHRCVLWWLFISWIRTLTTVHLLGCQLWPDQEHSVPHKLQELKNLSRFKMGLLWEWQIL